MSLLVNGRFPPINPTTTGNVSIEDRITAIDFVNRVNYLFEEFDHEPMLNAFLEDSTVYHFHGIVKGKEQNRRFLQETYGYLIPGVTRHATNHTVDPDGEDGVQVRYHEHLVRNSWPDEEANPHDERTDGLPAIWLFSPMIDRLMKTDEGWKIYERYVGASTFNKNLNPKETPAHAR